MLAAYHNRPRCIKELISNGADPLAHPEMMQPLKIAVEREYASGRVSDTGRLTRTAP